MSTKISNRAIKSWASSLLPYLLLTLLGAALFVWWQLIQGEPTPATRQAPALRVAYTLEPFQPLPGSVVLDAGKVALGKRLFLDARLSADDTISCASCHDLAHGGVDNRHRSIGIHGNVGTINAPTVFNSGFNFVQFWDGRAPTLEAQIDGPVNNPLEMGANWPQVLGKLQTDADYRKQFAKLYPDGLTADNVKDAIATFERSLITPDSRFDRFLRGDSTAMDATEQRGYELFQSYGCSSCHQGINVGGNMYEKMGLMGDYFADRGGATEADNGRYNVNRDDESMHEFKVPSLRNVALTAPYFHDGHAETLEQAVVIMAKYQLGRSMPSDDVHAVVAFLHCLTGELRGSAR